AYPPPVRRPGVASVWPPRPRSWAAAGRPPWPMPDPRTRRRRWPWRGSRRATPRCRGRVGDAALPGLFTLTGGPVVVVVTHFCRRLRPGRSAEGRAVSRDTSRARLHPRPGAARTDRLLRAPHGGQPAADLLSGGRQPVGGQP